MVSARTFLGLALVFLCLLRRGTLAALVTFVGEGEKKIVGSDGPEVTLTCQLVGVLPGTLTGFPQLKWSRRGAEFDNPSPIQSLGDGKYQQTYVFAPGFDTRGTYACEYLDPVKVAYLTAEVDVRLDHHLFPDDTVKITPPQIYGRTARLEVEFEQFPEPKDNQLPSWQVSETTRLHCSNGIWDSLGDKFRATGEVVNTRTYRAVLEIANLGADDVKPYLLHLKSIDGSQKSVRVVFEAESEGDDGDGDGEDGNDGGNGSQGGNPGEPDDREEGGLSTGALIGLAVGGGVLAIAAIGGIWFYHQKKKGGYTRSPQHGNEVALEHR